MKDNELLERITSEPAIMVGKPVVRGTRVTVEHVLNLPAHGSSAQDVMDEYSGLTEDDIHACLLFASKSLEDVSFMPLAEATA